MVWDTFRAIFYAKAHGGNTAYIQNWSFAKSRKNHIGLVKIAVCVNATYIMYICTFALVQMLLYVCTYIRSIVNVTLRMYLHSLYSKCYSTYVCTYVHSL
jgi:hypothetical protein